MTRLNASEQACYLQLRGALQRHITAHQLGAWSVYMITSGLCDAVCGRCQEQGMEAHILVDRVSMALLEALAGDFARPLLHVALVSHGMSRQPGHVEAVKRTIEDLSMVLQERAVAQGLALEEALAVSIALVEDALALFARVFPRAEVAKMVTEGIGPQLAEYLRRTA